MPLSMEVGLGPGHIVRWEPSSPKKGGGTAPIFDPCPLWPNGQTAGWIKIPLAMEVDLGLGDIVLDGDPAPPHIKRHSHSPSNFLRMSIVAKRLEG